MSDILILYKIENMEGELVAIIVSCVLSGGMTLYKIIKKFRRSRCMILDEKGKTLFELNINDIQKKIEEEITEELPEEQRKKLKEIIDKGMKKIKSETELKNTPEKNIV